MFLLVFVFSAASRHSTNARVIIGTVATGPLEPEFYCLCK